MSRRHPLRGVARRVQREANIHYALALRCCEELRASEGFNERILARKAERGLPYTGAFVAMVLEEWTFHHSSDSDDEHQQIHDEED